MSDHGREPSCEPTEVVLLTPSGRGAIATVLVQGPHAIAAVSAYFRSASKRSLAESRVDRILFGRWGGPQGEELVVCRRSDASVEIHCHGGAAAAPSIIADLVAAGCQESTWTDWLARHERDPIQAEARIAAASARTLRTAHIALDQLGGALRREVERCLAALRAIQDTAGGQVAIDEVQTALETLLRFAPVGLHIAEPWRVVLAGPPNVGKSSLINALVGYERSIVFETPGTTRDVVTATTAFDGWPVELADTAGLRVEGEPIELAGMTQARLQAATADAILLLSDASQPWTSTDQDLADAWPQAIRVHNKSDLPSHKNAARPAGIAVSALTGQGLDALIAAIAARLVPFPPPPDAAVPFHPRHVAAIRASLEALQAGDPPAAAAALNRLK